MAELVVEDEDSRVGNAWGVGGGAECTRDEWDREHRGGLERGLIRGCEQGKAHEG